MGLPMPAGVPLRPEHGCGVQGDSMVVCYLRDVRSVLQLRSLGKGSLKRDLPLPGLGCIRSFSGRRKDTEIFFSYTDPVTPSSNFRHACCRLL